MIEVLEFVFQSFWHWLGTLLLVAVIVEGVGGLIRIRIKKGKDGKTDRG